MTTESKTDDLRSADATTRKAGLASLFTASERTKVAELSAADAASTAAREGDRARRTEASAVEAATELALEAEIAAEVVASLDPAIAAWLADSSRPNAARVATIILEGEERCTRSLGRPLEGWHLLASVAASIGSDRAGICAQIESRNHGVLDGGGFFSACLIAISAGNVPALDAALRRLEVYVVGRTSAAWPGMHPNDPARFGELRKYATRAAQDRALEALEAEFARFDQAVVDAADPVDPPPTAWQTISSYLQ